MEDKTILDIIVDLLGLGILIWLLAQAIIDLSKGANKQKSVFHNLLIIGVCLIYSLKIMLKDLLSVI